MSRLKALLACGKFKSHYIFNTGADMSIPLLASLISLILALYIFFVFDRIKKNPRSSKKITDATGQLRQEWTEFLLEIYAKFWIVVALLFVIFLYAISWAFALAFLAGAVLTFFIGKFALHFAPLAIDRAI
jgi:Na+/H+-translocating membrane pyrophosphatase